MRPRRRRDARAGSADVRLVHRRRPVGRDDRRGDRTQRGHVAAGRATFVESALDTFGGGPCDKLFAARVRELATPDGLAVAHRLFGPGGVLLLAFDAPAATRAVAAADAAAGDVSRAGCTESGVSMRRSRWRPGRRRGATSLTVRP